MLWCTAQHATVRLYCDETINGVQCWFLPPMWLQRDALSLFFFSKFVFRFSHHNLRANVLQCSPHKHTHTHRCGYVWMGAVHYIYFQTIHIWVDLISAVQWCMSADIIYVNLKRIWIIICNLFTTFTTFFSFHFTWLHSVTHLLTHTCFSASHISPALACHDGEAHRQCCRSFRFAASFSTRWHLSLCLMCEHMPPGKNNNFWRKRMKRERER